MSALFIILVSLTMTLLGEKVLISDTCISGLMPNLIKKSRTVSSRNLRTNRFGGNCFRLPFFSERKSLNSIKKNGSDIKRFRAGNKFLIACNYKRSKSLYTSHPSSTHCPRTDLSKRFLPKPTTTTGRKGTP